MIDESVSARFWAKVRKDLSGCWIWIGGRNRDGYGTFHVVRDKAMVCAHRYAYIAQHGSVPSGKVLHHVCEQKLCVRPDHLQPLTRKEHMLVSPNAIAYVHNQKTHCCNGHALTGDNLRMYLRKGRFPERVCRTCQRTGRLRFEARRKGLPLPPLSTPQAHYPFATEAEAWGFIDDLKATHDVVVVPKGAGR